MRIGETSLNESILSVGTRSLSESPVARQLAMRKSTGGSSAKPSKYTSRGTARETPDQRSARRKQNRAQPKWQRKVGAILRGKGKLLKRKKQESVMAVGTRSMLTLVLTEREMQTPAQARTTLLQFLKQVAKGTWWTRLDPTPDHPEWGAKVVYVIYAPRYGGSGTTMYSVSPKPHPTLDSVPLRVGAGSGEIERVADRLLAQTVL